ncbi:MAG: cupin domain-containing protein [Vicinamibacterales bacterium]
MTRNVRWGVTVCGVVAACGASFAAGRATQAPASGPSYVSAGGTRIRPLLGPAALGSDSVEFAEITFPANADSGDHPHGSAEIFYIVSGELEHIVNGQSTMLKPGMMGFVKPPDKVRHKTTGVTKALVIWTPAGEADRIVKTWKKEP